jgi:hypothetical protein
MRIGRWQVVKKTRFGTFSAGIGPFGARRIERLQARALGRSAAGTLAHHFSTACRPPVPATASADLAKCLLKKVFWYGIC